MTIGRVKIERQDILIGLVAALSVIVYVVASGRLDRVGFPLDDSWIHQTYGRNLAERGEWAFVPGEPSVASTSPLFTTLLAAGYVLHVPFFVWTFSLEVLALAGAGWVGRRLGRLLFPDLDYAGLWTGLALVTTWHLAWAAASGMETVLFCTWGLTVVWLGWRELQVERATDAPRAAFKRGALLGLFGALLTLARPEGIALLGLVGLFVLLAGVHQSWRVYLAWAVGVGLLWLIGVGPYLAINYHIDGSLLPNTIAAKQAEHVYISKHWSLIERYGRLLLPLLAGSLTMLLPGIVYGLIRLARRVREDRRAILFWLPLAWAVLDLSAYAIKLPANYQHGRYVMPILPHLLLYGVGGTVALVWAGRRTPLARVLSRSLALSAVLITIGFWIIGAQQYARDVRIINTEMVKTAKWVKQNLPPDQLLAVHDIGAVGYYAPRPILDLAGLVSPEVVPVITDHEALMALMCERQVRYLMVLPNQRPTTADDPRLGPAPIFVTGSPYSLEAGGGNMTVYELHWPAACR